jgi:hypothetical protein
MYENNCSQIMKMLLIQSHNTIPKSKTKLMLYV